LNDDRSGLVENRTTLAIVNDRLGAVGIKTGANADIKNHKRTAQFNRSLDEKLENFAIENGRKPKDGEIEDIIDKMLIKGEANDTGIFSDDDIFLFEKDEDVQFNIQSRQDYYNLPRNFVVEDIEQLPGAVRNDIVKVLQKSGLEITNENIMIVANNQIKRNR
jgi:hypothetical protein